VHQAYSRAPEVTRRRLYLETMERVIPATGGRLFLDNDATGVLPFLPLDRFRAATAPETPVQPAAAIGGSQ
jgi:membrane protease subunit HflK